MTNKDVFDTDDPEREEASEIVDQLQSDDTLIERGVGDVLDEGYITADDWSPAQGFGNTPEEMRRGETIDQREKQIAKEPTPLEGPWNPDGDPREVGTARAGRLVDARDGSGDVVGAEAGLAGGAASAEEAAMHVIDVSKDEDDEDE